MRTLFAKIVLWLCCAAAVTVVGSAFVSALSLREEDTSREAPLAQTVIYQLSEARHAYETGGSAQLKAFFTRLNKVYGATGILTDAHGRDLLTGADRSDLMRQASRRPSHELFRVGRSMVARSAEDGKYWFFQVAPRRAMGAWVLAPELLFVMAALILLCYWLAYHLTSPVRKLQRAVERFGRGDFSARVNSTRRDELGQLARTFDRMAERIDTLMAADRRLLLDVSHELRSPLARLGVAVELARSGDDPQPALDRIEKESQRLNSLVCELLQVTRAEVDPAYLRRETVPADEIASEVVSDAQLEAGARGCRVELIASEKAEVEGDPELLRLALENVVRNAVRHSPPNGEIQVSLTRTENQAVLKVRDFGPGVPDEKLTKIFDPFYRVEEDRNRTSGGLGLGLAIARRAIDLHRGSIIARNAHPGLEIEISLPAKAMVRDVQSVS